MRILLLLLAMLLLTAPAGLAGAQDLMEVELFLTYIPNVQFAPVYVALANGYFAEAGLDVSIRHGAEHDGVDLVAANKLQLGIFGGEQVLLARAQGRPVVSVYEWFQSFPAGVVAAGPFPAIESLADLAGKRVGIHGRSGVTWSAFLALISAAGLTEQDFVLETVGFNVPELLCLGHIDAAVAYLNNEPLQLQNRMLAADCGDVNWIWVFPVTAVADLVSNSVVSNEMTIEQHPQLVEAFVTAFDRGVLEVIDNPAAAMLISAEYVEGLVSPESLRYLQVWSAARAGLLAEDADADVQAANWTERMTLDKPTGQADLTQYEVLLATIPMWQAEITGYSEREAWVTTAEVLQAAGMLEAAPEVELAFTNRFVPGCAHEDACQ